MNKKDLVNEWLAIARNDFETAEFLLEKKRPIPVEIVCFHAQQAAEKGIKAVLELVGSVVPRTHDLVELVRQTHQFDSPPLGLLAACSELSVYGVTFRYPGSPDLNESDARQALVAADLIMAACLELLSNEGL